MTFISSRAGWSGRDARNLAAMRTRRSLASMPTVQGWALLWYHGARLRWSSTSAGWWPAVAYQVMARVWQASWNGAGAGMTRSRRHPGARQTGRLDHRAQPAVPG